MVRRLVARIASEDSDDRSVTVADIVDVIGRVDAERVEQLVDEETLTDVDVPEISFDEIGGHRQAKRRLIEQTERALSQQSMAADFGVEFGNGILLHGPRELERRCLSERLRTNCRIHLFGSTFRY